jgi:hypothetical protein
LQENFSQKTMDANKLKLELQQAEETLAAASSLLNQLSGEN